MSGIRLRSPRRFYVGTAALVFCAVAFVFSTMAAENSSRIPDLSGQWGRDMLFFEPPASGPGPVINSVRKADGTVTALDRCCAIVTEGGWLGDHTNPVLKPETAVASRSSASSSSTARWRKTCTIPAGPSPHPM